MKFYDIDIKLLLLITLCLLASFSWNELNCETFWASVLDPLQEPLSFSTKLSVSSVLLQLPLTFHLYSNNYFSSL